MIYTGEYIIPESLWCRKTCSLSRWHTLPGVLRHLWQNKSVWSLHDTYNNSFLFTYSWRRCGKYSCRNCTRQFKNLRTAHFSAEGCNIYFCDCTIWKHESVASALCNQVSSQRSRLNNRWRRCSCAEQPLDGPQMQHFDRKWI